MDKSFFVLHNRLSFSILSLQAVAAAQYKERRTSMNKIPQSEQERADRLAIAYVTSHNDVSEMSISEFWEAYKAAYDEFLEFRLHGN